MMPGLSREEMERIYQSFPGPREAETALDIARGARPGVLPDIMKDLQLEDVSQLGRYVDTRQINPASGALYSLILGPAWEGWKASALSGAVPAATHLSDLLAKAPPELRQFSVTTNEGGATTKPSLANIAAPMKGLASSAMESGNALVGLLRSLQR